MENFVTLDSVSIKQALKKIGEGGQRCLVVVDAKHKLLGTLSDGDLRKAILNGASIDTSIEGFYYREPTFFKQGEYTSDKAREIFSKTKFDLIPIVGPENELIDILFLNEIVGETEQEQLLPFNTQVVIMAGGRGSRLEPFSKVLPKPLIPVNEKPIIEHIIERFTMQGCNNFHLTVSYKARILKAYFEELQPKYKVNFVEEQEPMGTAGSLRFLEGQFNQPFFLTNCDIIIKADYISLLDFHLNEDFDLTLVASAKEYIIPYGTCDLNNEGHLLRINEKPKYDFLINTGLYVLKPDVLKLIPGNKFFHITDLIKSLQKKGKKVGVFPIDDDAWIDVGHWAEYKQALEML